MSVPPPGPLAYEGQVVVPFIVRDFPPTTAFNQFSVPTIWIEPSSENAYILTGKPHGVANWLLFVNGGGNVGTLKGNTGAAVGPTVGGLINVVGDGTTITIAGNPGTNTLTASLVGGLAAIEEFLPDSGTTPVVPNASGAVTIAGSGSITTVGGLNSLITELTGLTNHNVLVGAGTTTITKVAPGISGTVLASNGAAADPSFQTLASLGTILTITGNSGGAETPTAGGNFNVLGTGSITVAGSANTETVQLTGLTNHAVLVGAGTATITNVGPSATTGAPLISAGAAADPAFATTFQVLDASFLAQESASNPAGLVQISVVNTDNTNSSSAARLTVTTGGAAAGDAYVLYDINASSLNSWEVGADHTTAAFQFKNGITPATPNLTGSTRFAISGAGAATFNSAFTFPTADGTAGQVLTTNGAGTVSWANSGEGTWTAISASQTLAVNNGYFCTAGAALSLALPATSAVGDTIDIVLDGSTSWTITQPNAATRIRIGNQQTTLGVGGTLASTAQGDTVKLVCETANARWAVVSMIGNITVV